MTWQIIREVFDANGAFKTRGKEANEGCYDSGKRRVTHRVDNSWLHPEALVAHYLERQHVLLLIVDGIQAILALPVLKECVIEATWCAKQEITGEHLGGPEVRADHIGDGTTDEALNRLIRTKAD